MSSYAYVTLLLNSGYLPGTLTLARSIRETGSTIPIILLYSRSNIKPEIVDILQHSGFFYRLINVDGDLISSRNEYELVNLLKRSELDKTLTKLNSWRLIEFDKLVYIDSDVLVVHNIDDLFDKDVAATQIYAASDCGWPDCFNSGLFLFKPSLETFGQLKKFAETTDSFDGSDQGILNEFFHLSGPSGYSWTRLPFSYNCTLNTSYEYVPALVRFQNDLHVIHFIGASKPWSNRFISQDQQLLKLDLFGTGKFENFHELWWDTYDRIVIDGKNSLDLLILSDNLQPVKAVEEVIVPANVQEEQALPPVLSAPPEQPAEESNNVDFPRYYYKPSVYTEEIKDESAKGEAWRLDEPKFNFPQDNESVAAPAAPAAAPPPQPAPQSEPQQRQEPAHQDVRDYTQEYVKEHPIFPWERRDSGSHTTRVFYNSPAYQPPAYAISIYNEKKLKVPAFQKGRNTGSSNGKKNLVGFVDGEELEHYLEEVEKLPAYQDDDDELEEKNELKVEEDENNAELEESVRIPAGPEGVTDVETTTVTADDPEDTFAETEKVATDPSSAKVEKDLDDEEIEASLLEKQPKDEYLEENSEEQEEANVEVDAYVEDLTTKVTEQLKFK
ncbi:DEKNAAC105205 [Brettanomyces naardenensis]|uniref:glycogenin glucosyltransferase n=1 Tax=Brettanomyces naardenensis TaxID=13370 RepID=A0A448YSL9_BRENA|nr:DEKNAAC105205 [Brettanomyces naardenensis]